MKTRIEIRECNQNIHLSVYKFIHNQWKVHLNTENSKLIETFISSIQKQISSFSACNNLVQISLNDQSVVTIQMNSNLEKNPLIQSLIKKARIENYQKLKAVRTFLLSLGFVATFTGVSKNIEYSKEFQSQSKEVADIFKNFQTDPLFVVEGNAFNLKPYINIVTSHLNEKSKKRNSNNPSLADIIEKNKLQTITTPTTDLLKFYSESIPSFGLDSNDDRISFVHEHYSNITEKYSLISGIDAHLLECIFATERTVHSSEIDPLGAVGIAQIQYNVHINHSKTLHNVITGETESFMVTDNLIRDLEGNIKIAVAYFQAMLEQYDGNVLIALQAYNYGDGAMNTVLRNASNRTGISVEEMIANPYCLVWIDDVKSYKDGGYGNPNYINDVLSRYSLAEHYAYKESSNMLEAYEKVKRISY